MRRNVRRLAGVCFPLIALLAAPALSADRDRHSSNDAMFSVEEYVGWIAYMASDEMEGRGTGQEGIDKAAEYIASIWESFGVQPAGDDNSFFQNFQLALSSEIGDGTRLSIGTDGRRTRKPATLHEEYVPLPFSSAESFSGNVVFAGYGIANESKDYDDYADIDVKDKVVLVLRRGPAFAEFGMNHVSFRAKSRAALDRGATALLIVNNEEGAALYDFERRGRGRDHGIPMMHVTRELASRLLTAGGLSDIETVQNQIEETLSPASAALEGVSVRGRVDIAPVYSDVRNVVGMIPGTGPQQDEIIVLGAHYDHLGIRNKDKPTFDPTKDISNGADDNASGTAMLMQLAKMYTRGESPNRTLVLIAFTGEELGLLGSKHFSDHPTIDLDKCITMLNFDMVGRLKNDRLEVGGMRTGGFEDMIDTLAKPYGFDIRDGGGGRGPSDHTHFYTHDIPVLFFFTGIHKQYHRPEDDTPLINGDGAMQIARFCCDVLDTIDSNPTPPEFKKDSRRASIGRQDDRPSARSQKRSEPRDTAMGGPRRDRDSEPVRLGVVPLPTANGEGLLIDSVTEGMAASNAGMRAGDRIVRIGKVRINSIEDALKALSSFRKGDRGQVRIVRAGQRMTLDVQFGDKPKAATPKERTVARIAKPDRLEGAIIDRIVRFLTARGAGENLSKVELKKFAGGFEVSATIKSGTEGAGLLGDLMSFVADLVETHSKEAGVEYDFTISVDTEFMFASDSSMSVTIRVEERGSDKGAHTHAAPPAHGGSRAHASTGHGGGSGSPHGRPHGGPISGRPRASSTDDAHGHEAADDVENNTMPPVRLGIMPTYGESEGEGFEIAGVVEGGAAEKGGMKDDDRILSIDGAPVKDVYTYMDALRKCKPDEKIRVVVLRNGKRVELTIIAASPKSQEAA